MANDTTRITHTDAHAKFDQPSPMRGVDTRATLEPLASLQRELAEARKIMADAASALTNDGLAGVIAAQHILLRAPAPSDVKGEEPSASDTNGGGKHIESDTKLTPLDDPSVRGVLVDDGEPRCATKDTQYLSWNNQLYRWAKCTPSTVAVQPVKLRPASDFGAAARGEPGLKKLESGMVLLRPAKDGESPDGDVAFGCMVYKQLDPLLYGIPDGVERERLEIRIQGLEASRDHALNAIAEALAWPDAKNRTIENAVSNLLQRFDLFKATHNASLKAGAERIKELEAELDAAIGELSAERDLCDKWELANREAERLRKAIDSHKRHMTNMPHRPARHNIELWSALSPSPAAAAESQGNAQHHSEGAKILKGGSGSSAEESEGGEVRTAGGAAIFAERERLDREIHRHVREKEALSTRLAACEERCRELEAGIENHRRDAGDVHQFSNDRELWSLLAPKAGGESQA